MRDWRGWECRLRRSVRDARASAGHASASMETASRRRRVERRGCRRRRQCPAIGRRPARRCWETRLRQPTVNGADAVAVVADGDAAASTDRTGRRCRPGIDSLSIYNKMACCYFIMFKYDMFIQILICVYRFKDLSIIKISNRSKIFCNVRIIMQL